LQTRKEPPVANYLRDRAKVQRLLAKLCRRVGAKPARLQIVPQKRRVPVAKDKGIPVQEWEGSYLQVVEAIEEGSVELLALFFDYNALFDASLADAFDAAPGSWDWRLMFVRKRRGRPSDRFARTLIDSHIKRELMSATLHSGKGGSPGKQESAINDLKASRGISRATIMRAKSRSKGKRKSHKMP
jgi:hypothetical protein